MEIIIDFIIILIILMSIFLGYKKGLIELSIHLLAFIIGIIITIILYRPIGNLIINNTQIDEKLQETIQVSIENFISQENNNQVENNLVESAKNDMLPETSRTLSVNIIYGIIMILLFVISKIVLICVSSLANNIAKLPLIKQFNELGGGIFGLLRGLFITYVILMLISVISMINPKSSFSKIIEQSYITRVMSTYNILNIFFTKT